MPWFKVDDGFANARQVLSIPRRHRCKAIGLWTLAGTWAAKELTDGFIPDYLIETLGATPNDAQQLVYSGLWSRVEHGYQVVGWDKYQFTKTQVMERRANEAERKQRAREAKRQRSDQHNVDNVRNVSHWDTMRSPHGVRAESALPDPTRPDQTHLLLLRGNRTQVAPTPPEPPQRCPRHTNTPVPPPCSACADARRTHDTWTADRQHERDQANAARRQAITDCPHCDDNGNVEISEDTLAKCNHPNTQGATTA